MNWSNIDLNSSYEASQDILDGYSFETLLLEIHCNLKVINKETVKQHFENELKMKIQSARDIFEANIENVVKKAIEEKNKE